MSKVPLADLVAVRPWGIDAVGRAATSLRHATRPLFPVTAILLVLYSPFSPTPSLLAG